MPYMEGKAEVIQVIDLYEEERHAGVFLLEARCAETGNRFTDGYHPIALELGDIRQVLCPYCRLWHELVAREPIKRTMMRPEQIKPWGRRRPNDFN